MFKQSPRFRGVAGMMQIPTQFKFLKSPFKPTVGPVLAKTPEVAIAEKAVETAEAALTADKAAHRAQDEISQAAAAQCKALAAAIKNPTSKFNLDMAQSILKCEESVLENISGRSQRRK